MLIIMKRSPTSLMLTIIHSIFLLLALNNIPNNAVHVSAWSSTSTSTSTSTSSRSIVRSTSSAKTSLSPVSLAPLSKKKPLLQKCKECIIGASILFSLSTAGTFSCSLLDNTRSYNVANAYTSSADITVNRSSSNTRLYDKEQEESIGNTMKSDFGGINLDSIRQSLVEPTEDKPQIMLPPNSITESLKSTSSSSSSSPSLINRNSNNNNKSPIMEGMVYLLNTQQRPELNDNIILTISSTTNPDDILAGAKYNVYKAKFPFNFKMYDANILKGKEEDWKNNIMNGSNSNAGGGSGGSDYIVTARVCPEEITTLPCKEEESTYFAQGVSKLLQIGNLPGGNEGDIIRTAVSLPLVPTRN